METPQVTVELSRGYVDRNGEAHKTVVLRLPTMNDEVKADIEAARLRASKRETDRLLATSANFYQFSIVLNCVVSWGKLVRWDFQHIEALTRPDARKLVDALTRLEVAEGLYFEDGAAESDELTERGN
jgi:hypothetical protein